VGVCVGEVAVCVNWAVSGGWLLWFRGW